MRIRTIFLIVLCQSMQGFAVGGIALFLPLVRADVGLTFSEAGTLAGASTLVFAAMQVPSGYLADRLGPKRLFLVGLLGLNAASLVFSQLHSYPLLLCDQAVSGLFRSLVFAPGLLLITNQFPPERRATALGLYVAGGFSSNVLLSSLGPILVSPLGWRMLFVIFSVFGALVAVAYWKLGDAGPPKQPQAYVRLRELYGLLTHPVMWVSGGVQFIRYAVVNGLNFWLPSYLVADKHLSLGAAGLVMAMGAVVTAPSNYLGGYLSDRLGRPALVIGVSLAMLAVSLSLLVVADSLPAIIPVVILQSVFLQFYFGPLFDMPIRILGPRTAGLTTGWSNLCANVGGLTFSVGLGRAKDITGSFDGGFYAMIVLCVVGIAGAYLLSRMRPAAVPVAARPTLVEEGR
jgi:nitrate/nitrite transporter NarK